MCCGRGKRHPVTSLAKARTRSLSAPSRPSGLGPFPQRDPRSAAYPGVADSHDTSDFSHLARQVAEPIADPTGRASAGSRLRCWPR
jgi:hypothetical protein